MRVGNARNKEWQSRAFLSVPENNAILTSFKQCNQHETGEDPQQCCLLFWLTSFSHRTCIDQTNKCFGVPNTAHAFLRGIWKINITVKNATELPFGSPFWVLPPSISVHTRNTCIFKPLKNLSILFLLHQIEVFKARFWISYGLWYRFCYGTVQYVSVPEWFGYRFGFFVIILWICKLLYTYIN